MRSANLRAAASSWTARRSSVVDDAIKLVCTGIAHKARGALSGLSGRRHGRWCRVRAPSSARTSEPSDLFAPPVTKICTIYSHNQPTAEPVSRRALARENSLALVSRLSGLAREGCDRAGPITRAGGRVQIPGRSGTHAECSDSISYRILSTRPVDKPVACRARRVLSLVLHLSKDSHVARALGVSPFRHKPRGGFRPYIRAVALEPMYAAPKAVHDGVSVTNRYLFPDVYTTQALLV